MCFSAYASFATAAVLACIGTACIQKASYRMRYCAYIPLLFAAQQASEGCVWYALEHTYLHVAQVMSYIFLFFAFFVWPVLVPYACYHMEEVPLRKKLLRSLYYCGLILGTLLYGYSILSGIYPSIVGCHIYYDISISSTLSTLATIAYLICTVGAGCITTHRSLHVFAVATAAAYGISYYVYYTHLISVWCFFAAWLSSYLYLVIRQEYNDTLYKRCNN